MTSPRISVVMPCYNAASHLPATLDSLRAQTFPDWELITVDDGSTDETARLLSEAALCDPRIRLVRVPNGGPSRARNIGALELARAEIVAFLDADDLCVPTRLASLLAAFASKPGAAALYGRVSFFEADPARPSTVSAVRPGALTTEILLGENPVCTTSNLAVRRAALQTVGGFDARLAHHEDVELLLRLVAVGCRIEGLNETHIHYRTRPDGLSADLGAMRRGWRETLRSAAPHRPIDRRTARRAEAIHLRYLARRALRTGAAPMEAARLALAGLQLSPSAFFDMPRRGLFTLAGALAAPALPAALRRRLFA
ncbi:MAG: glycosyltransferase family 2 protein [Paracoccaceae bacterium]